MLNILLDKIVNSVLNIMIIKYLFDPIKTSQKIHVSGKRFSN